MPGIADKQLAERYERVRQARRQGQLSNEMTLLVRQGMLGWVQAWQHVAAQPAGDAVRNAGVAAHDLSAMARGLLVTEMVSIAAAMISGTCAKERIP